MATTSKSKVSFHCGKKLSRDHNIREFDWDKWNRDGHIDQERIHMNITLNDSLQHWNNWCEEVFGQAIDEFNEKNKVKHPDRVIDRPAYYREIRKKVQESIIQIGNGDFNPLSNDEHIRFLKDVLGHWKQDNPSLMIVGAYIHMDETTPHMHLDWIPVAHSTRGQSVKVSMDGALKELGYARKKEHKFEDTPYKNWIVAERSRLEEIGSKYCNIEEADHTHQKHHQETYEYRAKDAQQKAKKAQEEAVTAEKRASEARSEVEQLQYEVLKSSILASAANKDAEKAEKKVSELQEECENLEEKKGSLNDEIGSLRTVETRIENIISNQRQELDQIRDETEFEHTVARIMAMPESPHLPVIQVYDKQPAKKNIMGKETAPALTILPSDQFDRFYNAAVALSRASEDTYRVKQVAKAANLKVAQQALYKAQEEEIKDLKKENDSLRSWKNHTYDYDELENKVTKLEKTVDVLKSVATKMFRFIKNLVFHKNGEETDGLDELKDATDIMDDPEEKEMFEEIEYDATRKHGLWFL